MTDGLVIDWLDGNCPVQAEGTFDGHPFYFRARGTQVTLDVGEEFAWRGPEYEWPDAGWISDDIAKAYIEAAYHAWQIRDHRHKAKYRRRNGFDEAMIQALYWAGRIERALGEAGKPAVDYLMAYAQEMRKRGAKEPTDE